METVPYAGQEIVRTSREVGAISVIHLHWRLAHLPLSAFSSLRKYSRGLPPILPVVGEFDCKACSKERFVSFIPKARLTRPPHPDHTVHSNICGPFSAPPRVGVGISFPQLTSSLNGQKCDSSTTGTRRHRHCST
jgi:hypothetical protein